MSDIAEIASNKLPSLTQLRRRTLVGFLRTWREIRGTARQVLSSELAADLPKDDLERLRRHMQLCYDSPGGEVTARAHTAELGRIYLSLNDVGRTRFLKLLASAFDLDGRNLRDITVAYSEAHADEERHKLELSLRDALVTPRSTILKQFTALPDGVKFLINLRADLLPLIGKDIQLRGLEYDLKAILSSWFDVGLLDLSEITWQSPAALLEKIIEYEAVHRVSSWDDLKNRLDSDRRVFAFFHNKMPNEPLIFVHVALVEGMSDNIQVLLDEKSPVLSADDADTAIFYSITNAQKGLTGISFGNFLIKRVVSQLTDEMRHIKTFATLSPVPGFRAWLDSMCDSGDEALLSDEDKLTLATLGHKEAPLKSLKALLNTNWAEDTAQAAKLKPILMRLCAHYLVNEKKNGRPLDPVAGFHLLNGARLERLNWLADISAKGFKQSAAIMVNYHYKLDEIDDNHEEFVTAGKIVAGKQVKSYLK